MRKLLALGYLSEEERDAFLGLLEKPHTIKAGTEFVADGSSPGHSTALIDGVACRYKLFGGGRRQIFSLQYGGDITDIHSYVLKKMDHAVQAVTDCTVATMPHERMRTAVERYPNLALVLWRDTLQESEICRVWLAGIGRKSSVGRLAHFFCEQFLRLQMVGLTHANTAPFPVTQTDIADCLGLSLVHVNRTLQELRGLKLIEFRSKTLTILDEAELTRVAEFDPTYLRLSADQWLN